MQTIKTIYQKHKQLIPVLLLTLFIINTIVSAVFNKLNGGYWGMTLKNYAAIILLILNLVIYFKSRSYYKYALFFTLILGATGLIVFTPFEASGYLQTGSLRLSFQPVVALIVIITFIINFKRTIELILDLFRPTAAEAEKKEKESKSEQLEKLKSIYRHKTSDELTQLLTDKRFVPEAHKAAKELLEERQELVP